jgi:hypothetical protein
MILAPSDTEYKTALYHYVSMVVVSKLRTDSEYW